MYSLRGMRKRASKALLSFSHPSGKVGLRRPSLTMEVGDVASYDFADSSHPFVAVFEQLCSHVALAHPLILSFITLPLHVQQRFSRAGRHCTVDTRRLRICFKQDFLGTIVPPRTVLFRYKSRFLCYNHKRNVSLSSRAHTLSWPTVRGHRPIQVAFEDDIRRTLFLLVFSCIPPTRLLFVLSHSYDEHMQEGGGKGG